ncbi:MAG: DUF4919 domain-containing protein [Bacteroidetes bacterium]|nr:DUF4919 domain-containing protein [Bacteroidota bacterium]
MRSFARICAHYDEPERALNLFRNLPLTTTDPWLLSTEIALSSTLGHHSRNIKTAKRLLESGQHSDFSTAELASALGSIELLDGNRRRSRDLLRRAIQDPNDNALAQVEWALGKDPLFYCDPSEFDLKKNHEALALNSFNENRWMDSVTHAENWFLDMPFARRPAMLGSYVLAVMLDNHDAAETFCRAALESNPNDSQLINNLAYSLALNGKASEAQGWLDRINVDQVEDQAAQVCLKATAGLVSFRTGQLLLGRFQYLEAIEEARELQNATYAKVAFLNYVREEIRVASPDIEALMSRVAKIKATPKEPGAAILLERVNQLYAKTRH